MQAFETSQLIAEQARTQARYLEFLRVPDLSMGLYVLKAGATDTQSPHDEDEIYVVSSGRAKVRVGDEDRELQPGSIVYVAKRVPHKFHSISEELHLLVFFAPAESNA
jgi:mannose-6-phosphate isomerase-like protein (cupin superfamily)